MSECRFCNPETGAQLFRVAQRMSGCLRESALRCEGVNLSSLTRSGPAGGLPVHLHVIPRFKGDGFGLRFADACYTRPSRAELESAARKIGKAIEQGAPAGADKPRR